MTASKENAKVKVWSVLSSVNPAHTFASYFLKCIFSIILTSIPSGLFSFFQPQSYLHFWFPPFVLVTSPLFLWLEHPVIFADVVPVLFSPASFYILSLTSRFSLQKCVQTVLADISAHRNVIIIRHPRISEDREFVTETACALLCSSVTVVHEMHDIHLLHLMLGSINMVAAEYLLASQRNWGSQSHVNSAV